MMMNVGYTIREIKLKLANSNEEQVKEELINGLIRQRYSQSQVEAINSNYLQYLTDSKNEMHKIEWEQFQVYRTECKKEVNDLINLAEGINRGGNN